MSDPDKAINEQYEEIERLKAKLAAHLENEGDECPLCKLEAENDVLRLRAKHVVQMVDTIRQVIRLSWEHKELFGGAVYLVDHSHMWALVRNAEDLEALLKRD